MQPERNLTEAASHCAYGLRALQRGDNLSAAHEYNTAFKLDPQCYEAIANLALIYLNTDRIQMAIVAANRAVRINPTSAEGWNNLGYILGAAGRFKEAEFALKKSVAISPTRNGWYNLGLCLYSLGEFKSSVNAFDEALKLSPGEIDIIDKRSISQLGCGKYVEGLIDNKVRWECVSCHPYMNNEVPEWRGEPLHGKTIVVLHEQGFGDTFQFCRFIPQIKTKLGAEKVILSVPASCVELMRVSKIADEVIAIQDKPNCHIDFKSPTMTVPAHLGIKLKNVGSKPYLFAPMRPKVIKDSPNIKVGLVWAGKPMYAQDRWRSMHVSNLIPLLDIDRVDYYSLQVDIPPEQELWRFGMNTLVEDLSAKIKDWSDTASIIQALDLVVSVDTAPAHLAAAMGKPVALMVPQASCWRWLKHNSTTSSWYPTIKIFRQDTQGEWSPVISKVAAFIKGMKNGS